MQPNRHYKTHTAVAPVILLILSSALLGWHATVRLNDFQDHQRELAKQSVEGTAFQISSFIREKQRQVANYTKNYEGLIRHLADNPSDINSREKLENEVAIHFPDFFAVTIANKEAQVLLGNFDLLVNEACELDIQSYVSNKYAYDTYIHPHTESYHFDIMAPWETKQGNQGVFFVSFKPDLLARLIGNAQVHRHELMLIKRDIKGLIEVTAKGSRNDLTDAQDKFFLTQEQQGRILFETHIKGSMWSLIDIPDPGVEQEQKQIVWGQTLILFLVFAFISLILLAFIRRTEKNRLASDIALNGATEQLQNALDFSNVSTWELDIPSGVFSWSHNVQSIFTKKIPHSFDDYLQMAHPDDRERIQSTIDNCKEQTTACHLEHRVQYDDQSVRWLEITGNLEPNKKDHTDKMIGLITDVSERKQAEVNRLSAEKNLRETLIREVHHRIKNNLQGVIGLLMQHRTTNPESKDIIELAASQLHTVSAVYGLECNEGDGEVKLADLAAEISLTISNMTGHPVRFSCNEEYKQPVLAKETSVAIALVLNELIINAVKHSGNHDNAPVQVNLKCTSDHAKVQIINKSSSLPHIFDFSNKKGLGTGLNLVKSLLPKQGADLDIRQEADAVIATLYISPPAYKDIH